MRAVSMNPESSRLSGVSVGRTLMVGWGLAAAVGALAGALVAPRLFLDVNFMASVLIYSFAAATLGGFDSPFGAVVGGWIIGVAETLAGDYVDFIGADLKILVPLAIILAVLLVRPERAVRLAGGGAGMSAPAAAVDRAGRRRGRSCRSSSARSASASSRWCSPTRSRVLGLNLLVGYSGQISLGHGAFFALGAYTAAILIAKHGWPHLATVPVAGAARRRRGAPRSASRRCACAGSTSRCSRSASRWPRRRSSSASRA